MAINIISMKYPHSDTGAWTANELDGIVPENAVLTSAAKKVAEEEASKISDCSNAVMSLKNVDRQIAELMNQREYEINKLAQKSLGIVYDIFGYTYDFAEKLAAAFKKRGFSSERVKSAVKKVRQLLFDDSKKEYQEILCTGITFGGDDDELMFSFEHAPSRKCFRIDIPVSENPISHKNENYLDYLQMKLGRRRHSHEYSGTEIYGIGVVYAWNSHTESSIIYHYDIRIIREQLDNFIKRGLEPISNPHPEYKYYSSYDFESPYDFSYDKKHKWVMSMVDYYNESI